MRTFVMLALLASASAAIAESPSATKGPTPKDKMICVNEPVVGSRLPKRICKTAEQWEQGRREARDTVHEAQTRQVNRSGS